MRRRPPPRRETSATAVSWRVGLTIRRPRLDMRELYAPPVRCVDRGAHAVIARRSAAGCLLRRNRRDEETTMAKKKKATTKSKGRDLKPRKQVKGGLRGREDPCQGGEIFRSR